jgi:hypothetical protein
MPLRKEEKRMGFKYFAGALRIASFARSYILTQYFIV